MRVVSDASDCRRCKLHDAGVSGPPSVQLPELKIEHLPSDGHFRIGRHDLTIRDLGAVCDLFGTGIQNLYQDTLRGVY